MTTTKMAAIQRRMEALLRRHAAATAATLTGLLPVRLTMGKLYEALVLSRVAEDLATKEGCTLKLVGGKVLYLKTKGGPLNRNYPYIQVYRKGAVIGELWTDVEFLSMSYCRTRLGQTPKDGDYHELDVVLIDPGLPTGIRPSYNQLTLAVECKATAYEKELLRSILGVRRELSLLCDPNPTSFSRWPATKVPADPSSCILVFSTDPKVTAYQPVGDFYGIEFVHEPM